MRLPSGAGALRSAPAELRGAAKPFARELERAGARVPGGGSRQASRSAGGATGRPREPDPWQTGSWLDPAGASASGASDPDATLRWAALQLQGQLWAWVLEQSLLAGEGGLFGKGFSAAVYGDWFVRAAALLMAQEGDGGLSDVLVRQLTGRQGSADLGPGSMESGPGGSGR